MESVLVLDDEPANLHGIAEVLRSQHYAVLEASTGLEAIEVGKNCGPVSLFVIYGSTQLVGYGNCLEVI